MRFIREAYGLQPAQLPSPPMERIIFGHVNIIAADWRQLSRFYQEVFGCVPVPPQRDQSGPWLEAGTGVARAQLVG